MASPSRTRYAKLRKDYLGEKMKEMGLKVKGKSMAEKGKLSPSYADLKKPNTSAKPRGC